jgi:predicted lipoprotein with Yx(FWY)xxD motif
MTRYAKVSLAVALLAIAGIAGAVVALPAGAAKKKAKPALALKNTSLGKVIVDSKGMTLYQFGADTKNVSNCADACAQFWPPAKAPAKPKVAKGLNARKLKVIKRADGNKQLSYAGHPLYRYTGDQKPGDVTGQGINAFGGLWYVNAASGKAVTKSPQRSGSPAPDPQPDPGPYPYPGY